MECKSCGSENVEYMGVDDGGGDYGSSVCDQYRCEDCGYEFEAHCREPSAEPEPDYDIPSPREPGVFYGDEPDPDGVS